MADQEIDAAVIAMGPAEIRRSGLSFDRCNMAMFDNSGEWSEVENALAAEMLGMLLPHAGKIMMMRRNHEVLKPLWAALRAHGGMELVDAEDSRSLPARALRRLLQEVPANAKFAKRAG